MKFPSMLKKCRLIRLKDDVFNKNYPRCCFKHTKYLDFSFINEKKTPKKNTLNDN